MKVEVHDVVSDPVSDPVGSPGPAAEALAADATDEAELCEALSRIAARLDQLEHRLPAAS
jgi:hypothetical protein